MVILLLVLLLLAVLLLWNTVLDFYHSHWKNQPPGPVSLPFLGGVLSLNPNCLPESLVHLSHTYGKTFSVRLGTQGRVVFLNSVEGANTVLLSKKAANRPELPMLDFLSRGGFGFMVAPYGELFRTHSRLCHLAFSQYLSSITQPILTRGLDQLWTQFSAVCGKPFNPHEDLRRAAFTFLSSVLFDGCNMPGKPPSLNWVEQHLGHHDVVMETLSPTSIFHILPFLLKFSNRFSDPLLQTIKARDNMLQAEYTNSVNKFNRGKNKAAFESMSQSTSIMTAFVEKTMQGIDTNSSTMEWIILLMTAFPKVCQKAKEEITHVVGKRDICLSDKSNLPYIEALLRECLRLSSPVGVCPPHYSHEDLTVEGYAIPKDTPMIVNIWAIHHDPELWTDPEELRPERFLDEDGQLLPVYLFPHYLPFSRGMRPCVGSVLARSFLFLFLGNFIQKFNVMHLGLEEPDLQGVTKFGQIPKPYKVVLTEH